jgi:DNA-binding response OmpR family regulator
MAIILVVEDEDPVRQLITITLKTSHQVIQATEATQAIELARLTHPDLILLDLNLQKPHDGLEVCQALRKEADPLLAQIPILMLTGQKSEASIKAALAAGATSYMGKPYSPHTLLTTVDTLLAKRAD